MDGRGRAKLQYFTTLTGLARALQGQPTIIDLRNESYVSGVVHFVDCNMNVEMRDAVYRDPKGNQHYFENFLVKNRCIRYIHIPEKLNPQDLLQSLYVSMANPPKRQDAGAKTFKKKRSERYNQQIIQENYRTQPGSSGKPPILNKFLS